jgi:hypothetical protein
MDYGLIKNLIEMEKYGHDFSSNYNNCKYCGLYVRIDFDTIKTMKCLSDEEKIIKDIIE